MYIESINYLCKINELTCIKISLVRICFRMLKKKTIWWKQRLWTIECNQNVGFRPTHDMTARFMPHSALCILFKTHFQPNKHSVNINSKKQCTLHPFSRHVSMLSP